MKRFRIVGLALLIVVIFFSICSISHSLSKGKSSTLQSIGVLDQPSALLGNFPQEVRPDIDIPLPLEGVSEQILYRNYYIVSYNKDNKIPNWVAWHLTASHTDGNVSRPGNAWHEDLDVPAPRANPGDYKGSGWTRGHMCPAGDNKWDSDAMYNTFLFTNCCPQNANLNSGTWNQIEISTRRWAQKFGDLYIVCGPLLFRQEHETIGENQIVVPEAFFKVVVCLNEESPRGIGFICRNTDGNRQKDLYVNTVKQIERITGMTFFPHLSQKMSDAVKNEANLDEWER